MSNTYYTFINPVVAGSTIRADKYNSDHQALQTAFDGVEGSFANTLQLPATFNGNPTIPDQTVENSFVYVNALGDIDLYSANSLFTQIATVDTQYNQINTWQGEVSTNKTAAETAASNAGTSETNAGTSETNAAASAVLAGKYSDEAENVEVVSGRYSAYHWAKKAEFFRDSASAIVSGDLSNYVPKTTTVNGKALSSNVTVQIADIPSLQSSLDAKASATDKFAVSVETGSQTITRQGNHTEAVVDANVDTTMTLSGSWSAADRVVIRKAKDGNQVTISGTDNIYLPDGTFATSHFIPAGLSGAVALTRTAGGDWLLGVH